MNCYLGIDGGGTKTKFLLTNEQGRVMAEYTGPTSHYMQSGFAGQTQVIAEGLAACLASAGIAAGEIRHVFAGLGAYGEIRCDDEPIREAAAAALSGLPLTVGNDGENALAGALGGEAGINVVAGTGSVAFGKGLSGQLERCGGWHQQLGGDEGSGYWLGQQLIHEFTRQSDGRDEHTLLYAGVCQYFALEDDYDLVHILISEWHYNRTRVAALSRLVAELARAGDSYCIDWFRQGAAALAELARTIQYKLALPAGSLVSGTGGIFQVEDLMLKYFIIELQQTGLVYRPPLLPPDRGALILAMQNDGIEITEAIQRNLARN